jgi:DNA-binding protein HU-beta
MTKDQFVRSLAETKEISIKQARESVNLVLDHIVEVVGNLEGGEKLDLTGVLQFVVSDVPAREGRNPSTGETIQLEATRKVNVKPMATLKSAVKGN